jgi:hypothetical protein
MSCLRTHLPKHCRAQGLSILLVALDLFRLEGECWIQASKPELTDPIHGVSASGPSLTDVPTVN